MIKARIFAIFLIALSIFLIYINWRELWTEGTYSMKLAAFAPVVGIGGLYLLLFPSRAGKPTTTAEKVTVLICICNRTARRPTKLVPNGSWILWQLKLKHFVLAKRFRLFRER
ncbi:MAG: hypothetical protein ACR2LM_10495 [Pyrinomonadaceae bacterium]